MTERISLAKENARHIKTLNKEMGEVRDEMVTIRLKVEGIETDVSWLKRFFFIVAASSIGSLIMILLQYAR